MMRLNIPALGCAIALSWVVALACTLVVARAVSP